MHKRTIQLERATVDADAGTVDAVLFTDGEASDGHILSMEGGDLPDTMPLFVNHHADPRTQLGSITPTEGTAHEKRVRLHFMLDGEGAEADVRRDIFAKIQAGHVSQMSGKWDALDAPVERRMLAKDHPAHVSAEAKGSKRWGLYFGSWRGMEGSVVGLGADPQATMRWAGEAEAEPVAAFWRGQAMEAEAEQRRAEEFASFGAELRCELVDTLMLILERLDALETQRDDEQERETDAVRTVPVTPAAPLPALSPADFGRELRAALAEARTDLMEEQRRLLGKRRGKA